ncbi:MULTISPECIES: hypothetical protein [unclassified Rhizobium]|nr:MULTISPECIES: hypothetical protein [unclassified Rhizobium]MBO9124556.1 hypothetical protein [Rhizobium sp. 16-488-2b]MBO9175092.1 hypothetical protein [Rhizobium sp. 16-488-2a]
MPIAKFKETGGRKGATLLSERSDFGFSADTLGSAGIDLKIRLQKERQ